jgi:hypothetical protein
MIGGEKRGIRWIESVCVLYFLRRTNTRTMNGGIKERKIGKLKHSNEMMHNSGSFCFSFPNGPTQSSNSITFLSSYGISYQERQKKEEEEEEVGQDEKKRKYLSR